MATRGLVVTVTQAYYGLVVAQRKYANVQRAAAEAARFLDISQKLEAGGEVAHADVLKAHIQSQQQQRDLQEAQIAMERSRLDLAVLLFPDFNQNFTVVDDLQTPEPLPTFAEAEAAGKKNNPDLRAAESGLQEAGFGVKAVRGEYIRDVLPTLLERGISLFAAEKGPGLVVGRKLDKLGYKGVETCEVTFEDYRVPAGNLIGGVEGRGFQRIHIALAPR